MEKKIKQLVQKKKAIILAHNYQPPEIQDIADLCGDSLELSIRAAKTSAEIIIFCGVHFMAESASILCPEKTVVLPVKDAFCPMADMVSSEALTARKKELENITVITYVNSSAKIKAMSDICCTSANVVKVVNAVKSKSILMVPDKNLAAYAAFHTDKQIHSWEGYCPFHNNLTINDVAKAKKAHPNAIFIAHPECTPQVLELADSIQSTSGMISFAGQSNRKEFILGTETGLLHAIKKTHPDKNFYPASEKLLCPDMKKIKLADILSSLENPELYEIRVPEETRKNALHAIQKMIEIR